ncbi:7027_t:CDS:2 [Paraglomus brasilianum]|uniref:7027_t:CDS:1 n=1 Tax=Paraglomus brasilianum TaxID=144538 RepID=A0A9N9A9A3_9GLOM|nr:7027_t:CDS:2 [Paraglomus brasilianum]
MFWKIIRLALLNVQKAFLVIFFELWGSELLLQGHTLPEADNFAEDIALPTAHIKARAIRTKKLNITCKESSEFKTQQFSIHDYKVQKSIPVNINNLLLRAHVIKNTEWSQQPAAGSTNIMAAEKE